MTSPSEPGAGSGATNKDLAGLHRQLTSLEAALELAIDDAPDAASVRRLDAQIAALNARVTAVGRQLFAAQTVELATAARDVAAAIPQVERALGDLARLDSAVSGLASVLSLVDKAVAIAKSAG